MSKIIGVVSQKGGVGKSTIARLLATEFARNGWEVKIADLDAGQKTCADWQARRIENGLQPEISVEVVGSIERALRTRNHYDLIILDGLPMASKLTLEMAQNADLVILPTSTGLDDLTPTVKLCHELRKNGLNVKQMLVLLSKTGSSESDIEAARNFVHEAGYEVLENSLPEKTAYRQALDQGRSLTETRYPKLNELATKIVQAVAQKLV